MVDTTKNQQFACVKLMRTHEFDNSVVSMVPMVPSQDTYIWCEEAQQCGKCKVYGPYSYGSKAPFYTYKWSCCGSQAKNPQHHVVKFVWCKETKQSGKCKIYGPYDYGTKNQTHRYKWSCCGSQAKNPQHHITKTYFKPKEEISVKMHRDPIKKEDHDNQKVGLKVGL